MARDYAAEYARRKELAAERGLTGADITAAARGRTPSTGISAGLQRRLENQPQDQPVRVITRIDRRGQSHATIVTKNRKGRSTVIDIQGPPERIEQIADRIEGIIEDADREWY